MADHGIEKFAKRLLGESDVEAILQRLDRLTLEEARITGARTLEVVHGLFDNLKVVVDGGMPYFVHYWRINETRLSRREGIDDCYTTSSRYALTCVEHPIFLMMHVSCDSRDRRWHKQVAELVLKFTLTVVEAECDFLGNQFQMNVRSWLSPPDPSVNHNIARRDHFGGTTSWFIQSDIYKEWTVTGSLLWIHGKRTPLSHLLLAHPDFPWWVIS